MIIKNKITTYHMPWAWSSPVEREEQPDRTNVWKVAMQLLHKFCWVCHEHHYLPIGPTRSFVSFY